MVMPPPAPPDQVDERNGNVAREVDNLGQEREQHEAIPFRMVRMRPCA